MARSVAQAAKCANGSLVITQAPLKQNSNCDFSYGGCSHSNTSRTQQNNCCVTCLGGYYDGNKVCSTYGGSCANGSLITQTPPMQGSNYGSAYGGCSHSNTQHTQNDCCDDFIHELRVRATQKGQGEAGAQRNDQEKAFLSLSPISVNYKIWTQHTNLTNLTLSQ